LHVSEGRLREATRRREALLSVLHGPRDWATEAAIRVLARLGRENEAWSPGVGDAFQTLADNIPRAGDWGFARVLYEHGRSLPHLFPGERKRMEQILHDMDARERKEGTM